LHPFPATIEHMRRLLAVALTLCMCFATITGVAVAIGRQRPMDDSLAALHLTDCAPPCWIGIVPGTTTLQQAKARIFAIYASSPSYAIDYDTSLPGRFKITLHNLADASFGAMITLDTHDLRDDLPVLTITINFAAVQSYPFTLGELVSQLGNPEHVNLIGSAGNNAYYLSLNYGSFSNRGIIVVLRSSDRINWEQQPYWLRFLDLGPGLGEHIQETNSPWYAPWRGFTTLSHYGVPVP
jgi:hypothetical protein